MLQSQPVAWSMAKPRFVPDVHQVGSSLFTTLSATQGVRVAGNWPTPKGRYRCLMHSLLAFLLAAYVPRDSHTFPRRHGRIHHQPEDASYRGFGRPAVLSSTAAQAQSRFEVDDRRTRGFRAPQRCQCLPLCLW